MWILSNGNSSKRKLMITVTLVGEWKDITKERQSRHESNRNAIT